MRIPSVAAALLVLAACRSGARDQQPPQGPASAAGGGTPAASASFRDPADSLYARMRARLTGRGYRIDQADDRRRRLVVRAPGDETRVEVRVVASGDSSAITVSPLGGGGDLVGGLRSVITVTHDATMDPEGSAPPPPAAGAELDELPRSRWRPEMFVSPDGRVWMASGGLYAADSLGGRWRRLPGTSRDGVDPDDLLLGTHMAFVDERTALVGLETHSSRQKRPALILRTTDGGASWSAVPDEGLAGVDAMAALGRSVWVIATRWEDKTRRGMFLRSGDGGERWERPALPAEMNDVTGLYRATPETAYASTAGFNRGPVFWRTADGGDHWSPVPTPHDQKVHEVPSSGVRVEQIATVGQWLVVREYGRVFVSRADSVRWRPLDGIEHVAADRERGRLFVLTESLHAAVLDSGLRELWRSADRVPDGRPSNIEKVLARDGVGYVSMSNGAIYAARDGVLRRARPKTSAPNPP